MNSLYEFDDAQIHYRHNRFCLQKGLHIQQNINLLSSLKIGNEYPVHLEKISCKVYPTANKQAKKLLYL